ncbi:YfiR family protein [Janthinobacterium fluminis]|uniref:YfiR family protein n=1 Tax=Janthinobacterium fluminis TaxID=2987524 RepID=A0ABT5K1R5_9BURK|nr:YfiR family protein [Janthinobacterium fluminis]MDC8758380.1 YfiR family protein [Janthinobacterium fluminis]
MKLDRPLPADAARRRHLACCLLLALFALGLAGRAAHAQSQTAEAKRAGEVAQVVFGIASYVRWPAPHAEIQLCLAGDTRYADALLDGQTQGQRIRTQRLGALSAAALAECQVVYIGGIGEAEREKLNAHLIGHPILAISEPIVPCSVANMFCLKFRDAQVGFDVNLDAIARSGLRVHPNALRIARRTAPQP